MVWIGLVMFGIALGFVLVMVFGRGRRSRHMPDDPTKQEERVDELHESSERYRAKAVYLEIRARQRELARERERELERERVRLGTKVAGRRRENGR